MKEAISPDASQAKNEQQWADQVERILRQWLLDQPYSTKLAFVLLNGCRLADNRTQAVFREISEKYKAEVIDAAVELPSTLVNIEVFLTGIAADMLHSEDRMLEPPGEDESDESNTAKPASKSDEDNLKSVPPDIAEKGKSTPGQPQ